MNDDITELINDELSDPLGYTGGDEEEAAAIPLPDEPPYRIPRGKYVGLVLPRMIGVKPSLLDKVDALKRQIVEDKDFQRHAGSISQTYAEIRREAEDKADELAEVKLRLTAVMQLMIEQYEVESTSVIAHSNGDKIQIHPEPHLIVTDKSRFRLACKEAGLESLMSLPWATANKLMKERALEGLNAYEGGALYMRSKISFTRGVKRVKP